MAHIMRKYAGKKFKMISELFINKNFEYTFVLFVSDQSLLYVVRSKVKISQNFVASSEYMNFTLCSSIPHIEKKIRLHIFLVPLFVMKAK